MTAHLAGKVAIVTGASAGIGEATAIALAGAGVRVAIAARRGDRLHALAQKIEAAGGEVLPVVTDISDKSQVNSLIQQVLAAWNRIDILVNNAGIAVIGEIAHIDPADWEEMFAVNLLGLMYASQSVLPTFKSQQTGHIVNISSVAGRTARAGVGAYNATKWGVNGFSEALRQEVLSDNVRVTVIEPGLVNTEISDRIADPVTRQATEERRRSVTPLESEDIAAAIVYAVSQPPRVNVNEILIRPTQQYW